MFGLQVCLCTMCKPDACGGQKKAMDPLELEVQAVVSYHMDVPAWDWHSALTDRSH